jgi:hypothetical protein
MLLRGGAHGGGVVDVVVRPALTASAPVTQASSSTSTTFEVERRER